MLAFTLAACAPGAPVTLLTGAPNGDHRPGAGEVGCYLMGATGQLLPDASAGTAITWDLDHKTHPISWPPGFTGRSSGDQVEVVDEAGSVVARTGTRISLLGGFEADTFVACGQYIKTLP
jgi:hypothetical protein